jgi:hypothetical protein
MDQYIHRENLTLFKKCLAEARTDAERDVISRLLADEETRETPPKNSIPQPS